MDTFFIEPEKFWDLFNQPDLDSLPGSSKNTKSRGSRSNVAKQTVESSSDDQIEDNYGQSYGKRMKTDETNKPRILAETEAGSRFDQRYIVLWGPYKPGKKNKVWEGDGYLTLIGQIAHLSDLRGRLLEEPTLLDDVDYKSVEEMGELMIGNTEVQIIELDNN